MKVHSLWTATHTSHRTLGLQDRAHKAGALSWRGMVFSPEVKSNQIKSNLLKAEGPDGH